MKLSRIICGVLLLMPLGCAVGPDYKRPPTELPAAFSDKGEPSTQPAGPAMPNLAAWWRTFNDPALNKLIEQVVSANPNIQEAQARLLEARARRTVTAGGQYPELDAMGGYTRERISANALPFSAFAGSGTFPLEWDLYQGGFDANWELDIFGGVRRNLEAANADLAASAEDQRDILVSVIAEVARNYVELRGYQAQLEIARENLAAQRETLELTAEQMKKGVATQLDVTRANAQVVALEAQIPLLDSQQWQAIHRLAVLEGKEPNALAQALSAPAAIPPAPAEVPIGLPSDLLLRRPDIRRAERQLAAATARIGAAKADLFPKFSLTGNFTLQASDFVKTFNYTSRSYSFGPAVSWPIFDAGRLRAQLHVQTAQQQAALDVYQATILTALEEVDDSLVAYANEQSRFKSLSEAVKQDGDAAEMSRELYQHGLTDFLTVLDAQRTLYQAQDARAQSRRNLATDLIVLYKALGGGWETPTTQPAASEPSSTEPAH